MTRLVESAKAEILRLLSHGPKRDKQLFPAVLDWLSLKTTRDGNVVHEILPQHRSAYITAYKQLEEEGSIVITRSRSVPFPMTDNATMFALK
jgi:hypothetical protein